MRGFPVILALSAALCSVPCVPAFAADAAGTAVPADPLGLDPGPEKDLEGFLAWAADPRTAPEHPLAKLSVIVQKDPKNRADYFTFLLNQSGIKGPGAKVLKSLAEEIYRRAPLTDAPPGTRALQKKDKVLGQKIAQLGREFFKLVPRPVRVRVYIIGEKFELAALARLDLVRMGVPEITDAWVDQQRAEEDRKESGYFHGLCRGRDAAGVRAVTEDFKKTVTFMLTFAGPPSYIRGDKARNKFRAEKRAARAKLLKTIEPLSF